MTFLLSALALSVATATAPGAQLLQPGLYRQVPDAHLLATPATPGAGQAYRQRYEHAVPAAAQVRYAFVSRDPQAQMNKLVFVTAADYHYDINSANRLCPAYAFPNWNDRSQARPFCRTTIGPSDSEAALDWTATQFSLRWADRKRALGSVQVPPQRAPTQEEAGACAISDVCPADAYGRLVNQVEVVHASDRFELQQPRHYVDVLYLAVGVPVHAQADATDAGTRGSLPAGSYVAVLTRTPQWYQIERIAQDGRSSRGWIERDAVVPLEWVAQTATVPGYRFDLGYQRDDEGTVLAAIAVMDAATGQRVQVLRDFASDPLDAAADVLQQVDVNADGHPDLLVPGLSGGAGPNSTSNVFLFDPDTGAFVHDAFLSGLPQLSVDAQNRRITTASRGGCCSHTSATYRYHDGRLQQVGSWEETLSADGTHLETTQGALHNGRMRYRTTRVRAAPAGE
ncbi:hypothetical protein KQ945_17610 [Bacillus subtilis subsp. subtilis]|nr:hypothetical protein [Bacillus subtilis subsp. subtilis]